jgi:hypothetical protein
VFGIRNLQHSTVITRPCSLWILRMSSTSTHTHWIPGLPGCCNSYLPRRMSSYCIKDSKTPFQFLSVRRLRCLQLPVCRESLRRSLDALGCGLPAVFQETSSKTSSKFSRCFYMRPPRGLSRNLVSDFPRLPLEGPRCIEPAETGHQRCTMKPAPISFSGRRCMGLRCMYVASPDSLLGGALERP